MRSTTHPAAVKLGDHCPHEWLPSAEWRPTDNPVTDALFAAEPSWLSGLFQRARLTHAFRVLTTPRP
jgi:hypothetical protein